MKKQPRYKNLTEVEYGGIKWLLTTKTRSEVTKTTGRSVATISYIDRSVDYAQYKAILAETNGRSKAKQLAKDAAKKIVDPVDPVTAPTEDRAAEILFAHVDTIIAALNAHTVMLGALNDKLDLVVVPKRRLF